MKEKEIEAYMRIPSYSLPVPSSDGDKAVVFKQENDSTYLHIIDLKEGDIIETLSNTIKENPLWGPNSNRLCYQTCKDNVIKLHVKDLQNNQEEVISLEEKCSLEDFSPNGQYVYYIYKDSLWKADLEDNTENKILSNIDLAPGSQYPFSSKSVFCSPNGSQIAYTQIENKKSEMFHPVGQITISDTDGKNQQRVNIDTTPILTNEDGLLVRDWHPDSCRLLVASHPFGGYCGIYNLKEDHVRWFGTELDASSVPFPGLETPLLFSPNGSSFVAWRLEETQKALAVYDLDGNVRMINLGGEINRENNPRPQFCDVNSLLVARENRTEPTTLATMNIVSGEVEPCIDVDYGNISPDRIKEPKQVYYNTADGGTAPGLLYESGKQKSSAIVEVYSGYQEKTGWPQGFRRDIQYLVANDFTVFQAVNPARPFSKESHAHYAAAGEWVKQLDQVNEKKVGVYGFSTGGYDALIQAFRFPETWDICISGDGYPDIIQADKREGGIPEIRQTLGDPAENEQAWHAQNPINELENIGDKKRCPLFLWSTRHKPEEPFKQLRKTALNRGWTENDNFYYKRFPDQGHIPQGASELINRWRSISSVLNNHFHTCERDES